MDKQSGVKLVTKPNYLIVMFNFYNLERITLNLNLTRKTKINIEKIYDY